LEPFTLKAHKLTNRVGVFVLFAMWHKK